MLEIICALSGLAAFFGFMFGILGAILDWNDEFIKYCFATAVTGLFLVLPSFILVDNKKPSFELKKEEWNCTESHKESSTTYIMVGKVMVPSTSYNDVCDNYRRIK